MLSDQALPEQRMILSNISWATYERLLADHENSSAPRFTYDRGMLEIMSPNPEHEVANRRIAQLVLIFAEEMGIVVQDFGSTTFRREDLERGFEPDSCFYIQNEERVRNKNRLDLTVDPPPDLVIEIDISSPSLDKLAIYARLGVPEVWIYDGERLKIRNLDENAGYAEVRESTILSGLTAETLTRFVQRGATLDWLAWVREVRGWARNLRT
ncbi:MAG: Uma2 family endonuclease [Rubrobacteraceae bacterium]